MLSSIRSTSGAVTITRAPTMATRLSRIHCRTASIGARRLPNGTSRTQISVLFTPSGSSLPSGCPERTTTSATSGPRAMTRAARLAFGARAQEHRRQHRGDREGKDVAEDDRRQDAEGERGEDAARDAAQEEDRYEHPDDDQGGERHRAPDLERARQRSGDRVLG